MKKSLFLLAITASMFLVTSMQTRAQDDGLDFTADFMSRYIWRGAAFGNSPSLQPTLAYTKKNLEVGAWGAFSTNGVSDAQELDLYLTYTYKELLSFTLTDYFFPVDGAEHNYFEYGEDKTGHIFEASLTYEGTDKLPLSVLVAVNFYGADAMKLVDDSASVKFNQKEGIQYSTYLELTWSTECKNGTDLDIFAGVTLNNPKGADSNTGFMGETGFYGNTMGFVNIGITASKEIMLSDKFNLPVVCSLITNPMAENIYMVFGFTL